LQILTLGFGLQQWRRRCWEAVNNRTDTWGSAHTFSALNAPPITSTSIVPAAAATPQLMLCADCNPSAGFISGSISAVVLHFNSSQQG
jgi:hypothetical protein